MSTLRPLTFTPDRSLNRSSDNFRRFVQRWGWRGSMLLNALVWFGVLWILWAKP